MTSTKHKEQVNITLSPYLKKELDLVVADKTEFSSVSDVCTIAITQFLERLRAEKKTYAPTGISTDPPSHMFPLSTENPSTPASLDSLLNFISSDGASAYL